MTVRQVSVKLIADIGGYISPMRTATQATKDFKNELSTAASAGKLDALSSMATRAGLALSGGFLLAESAAARFEKQMSEVDAVTNGTAAEMKQLSEAALQAGKDTSFSATEAAKAEAELGKAGLSTADILGGALSGSLALAAAGGLDLEEAADVAAKAMNVFGLEGKDVSHIADVLAAGANKSATDVHELGAAMKMGGLAAKNAGLSLEETVGTLSAFADNALVGSDAGTSFKTMLQMLAAPTVESTKRMKELGIEAYDASGTFVGVARLAGNLQSSLKNLTQEQRNEALATIFGADAMRAATILYGEGEGGIRGYTDAVNDQGAAAEMAAKKTDNLMGDIERLTGSLETLFITGGSGANGGLRALVQGAEQLIDIIGALPAPVLSAGVVITGLAGAGLLAFTAFIKTRGAFSDAMAELKDAGPISGRVAVGLERMTAWAGRAAIAITAVGVAGHIVSSTFGSDVNANLDAFGTALAKFGQTGEATGEASRLFGKDLEDLHYDLQLLRSGGWDKFFTGFGEAMEGLGGTGPGTQSIGKARERLTALDQTLAQMAKSGHAQEAQEAFTRIWQEASKEHITLEELQAGFPAYVEAANSATDATLDQVVATAAATKNNIALAGAFGEAASEADGLQDAFDALNGKELSWRDAERKAEAAVDDLTQALIESGGSMDVTTEKGRNAAGAADDLAEAAANVAQKKYDETGSVEQANAAYQNYVAQLRQTLLNAGWTGAAVDELVGKIAAMPQYKPVTFDVKVTGAYAEMQSILQTEHASHVNINARRWGGVTTHAATGALREAATFTPKSPARYAFAEPATKGEAFIPKSGDHGRSMSILSTAAGWYNADVVPRQGWYGAQASPAAASTPTATAGGDVTVTVLLDGQAIEPRMVKVVTERDRATKRRVQAGTTR